MSAESTRSTNRLIPPASRAGGRMLGADVRQANVVRYCSSSRRRIWQRGAIVLIGRRESNVVGGNAYSAGGPGPFDRPHAMPTMRRRSIVSGASRQRATADAPRHIIADSERLAAPTAKEAAEQHAAPAAMLSRVDGASCR